MRTTATSISLPANLDGLTVDPSKDWEVAYWTRKLGVSEDGFKLAIEAAGTRLSNVIALLIAESAANSSS